MKLVSLLSAVCGAGEASTPNENKVFGFPPLASNENDLVEVVLNIEVDSGWIPALKELAIDTGIDDVEQESTRCFRRYCCLTGFQGIHAIRTGCLTSWIRWICIL